MGFSGLRTYDADIETTFAFLCDAENATARYEAAGDSEIEVLRAEADGDGFIVETRRVVEVDLPGFAKKVLQPKNTMTQTDRWDAAAPDGSRSGSYEVSVDGAPVTTEGTMTLEASGNSCVHHITGEITVKIPLVGGRIAKWSAGTARSSLEHELDFNAERLGSN
jgi:hypothetical protein